MSIFEKSLLRILKKLSFDTNNNLKVVIAESPPVSVGEIDLTKITGTSLTPRDWSLDFENLQNIDVLLSSRASESTLSSILSRLDVALSSRASESTLNELSNKLPSAVNLSDNLANPSTTIIGSALLGWDGTQWRRLLVSYLGVLIVQTFTEKVVIDGDGIQLQGAVTAYPDTVYTVISYTVPPGKKLLVYDWGVAVNRPNIPIYAGIGNETDIIVFSEQSGIMGVHVPFTQPKLVPSGKTVVLRLKNLHSTEPADAVGYIGGILI
jgi:hypothetical protein